MHKVNTIHSHATTPQITYDSPSAFLTTSNAIPTPTLIFTPPSHSGDNRDTITLTNTSKHLWLAYKIQSNAQKKYLVTPTHGLIPPGNSSQQLTVALKDTINGIPLETDKMLIRCLGIHRNMTTEEEQRSNDMMYTSKVWKEASKKSTLKLFVPCLSFNTQTKDNNNNNILLDPSATNQDSKINENDRHDEKVAAPPVPTIPVPRVSSIEIMLKEDTKESDEEESKEQLGAEEEEILSSFAIGRIENKPILPTWNGISVIDDNTDDNTSNTTNNDTVPTDPIPDTQPFYPELSSHLLHNTSLPKQILLLVKDGSRAPGDILSSMEVNFLRTLNEKTKTKVWVSKAKERHANGAL